METTKKFKFSCATGTIEGPREYLESEHYAECKRKIEAGTHVLIGAFPSSTPIATVIEVIIQTDYAAWRGMATFGR